MQRCRGHRCIAFEGPIRCIREDTTIDVYVFHRDRIGCSRKVLMTMTETMQTFVASQASDGKDELQALMRRQGYLFLPGLIPAAAVLAVRRTL